ncbi:MAG: hypothetical protein C0404_01805 [Verrucomicrobia bacterium]|nr:hypothetical protein [Verrucomicrobiota bacterium]
MKKKKRKAIGFGTVVATLMFLGGAGILYSGVIRVYNSYASLSWPEAEGSVISSGITDLGKRDARYSFTPGITYEYSCGSETYVNNQVRFVPIIVSRDAAREFVARYPRGKHVAVRYKPSDPGVSVLEPGAFPNTWVNAVMGAIIVTLVAGICCVYWMVRQNSGKPLAKDGKGGTKARQEADLPEGPVVGEKGRSPQGRKGPLLKILWTALGIAVFCWLSCTGGETTVFRKIVAALFGWQMDVVLEVLGAVGAILLGITVVFLSVQVMTVPRMKPLNDPAERTPTPHPRDALEAELQVLGFRFIGDFDAAMFAATSMRIRAYTDADRLQGAILMDGRSGSERATILEFSTRLHPSGSVVTNTSPYPQIWSYQLDKCVTRVPWKKTAAEVLELHQALCRAAGEEKFTAEPFSAVTFADDVIKETRKDLEYQVEAGRYRRVGEDRYRQSLWGVVAAVPRLWLKMTYSFLFSWYRPPAGFFCWRVRRRLRKFKLQTEEKNKPTQSDAKDGETSEPAPKPISAKERAAPKLKM